MRRHSIDWNLQVDKEAKYQEFLDKINDIETFEVDGGILWIQYEHVLDIVQEVFCG